MTTHVMPFERQYAPTIEELNSDFKDYQFKKLLAVGKTGAVYYADMLGNLKPCAVKVLPRRYSRDPRFSQLFSKEASKLKRLKHKNMAAVYEVGLIDAMFFMSMEHIEGITLEAFLKERKLGSVEAASVVYNLCEALSYMHKKKVTHRNVEPKNVMITRSGQVKLIGFSGINLAGSSSVVEGFIWEGSGFNAPELEQQFSLADESSDIYSLGAVLCYALSGLAPDILIKSGKLEKYSEVLFQIVKKATQAAKSDRYKSVSDMADDLKEVLKSLNSFKKSGWELSLVQSLRQFETEAYKKTSKITIKKSDLCSFKHVGGVLPETKDVTFGGRYIIKEFLRSQSDGTVYRARDTRLERDVAITLIFSDKSFTWKGGFMSIIADMAKLEHPNIPSLIDADTFEGGAYLVHHLVHGDNLASVMLERPLTEREVFLCTKDVLDALESGRHYGFNNLSLSPESITNAGASTALPKFYISDFGAGRISSIVNQCIASYSLANVVDPALLPPEMVEIGHQGQVSTIYMLGNLAFHLLGSGHPYQGVSLEVAYQLHKADNLPLISEYRQDVSKDFCDWIQKCTSADMSQRYQTLKEALDVLRAMKRR